VWDCEKILLVCKSYNYANLEKNKEHFNKCNEPFKQYEFEVEGQKPMATSGCWVPSDNDLFAVGFETSHIALFNYKSGQIVDAC
jgi:hypothetical protein